MSDGGLYDKAIADFTKAVEIDPGFSDAYIDRGLCYFSQGEYTKAVLDYDRALEIAPDDFRAHWNRALCMETAGQAKEAVKSYKEVVLRSKEGSEYFRQAVDRIKELEKH
jgi:tetratricopeptide (TPR) repeat protein